MMRGLASISTRRDLTSALYRARCHSGADAALEEKEEQEHREGEEARGGHGGAPVGAEDVAAGRQPDREGAFVLVLDDENVDERELVPGRDEAEQRGGHEPRRQQREGPPAERDQPGAAVHLGRLLQLRRDAGEEAAE